MDPKKTQLGWVPHFPAEQPTQPYQPQQPQQPQQPYVHGYVLQQPPQEYVPHEYVVQPQQHVPHGYVQPPPYDHHPQHDPHHHGYAQPYAQQTPSSYPSAAAYNYQHDAAAIVQHMQREEQQAQTSTRRSKKDRSIPNANATQGASDRMRFIRLTYLHLLGAILAFAGLLWAYFHVEPLGRLLYPFVKFSLSGRWNWGVVLVLFMVTSWLADHFASHASSRKLQYLGLVLYILAESIIFVPLLVVVQIKTATIVAKGGGDPNIVRDAAYVTLGIFTALTASVFITKKDFSFLRSGLIMATGAALMLVVLSLAFGFNLGLVFSVAMVLLAAGYILYQTSQVLAHYDPRNHVAAALALFSSVALMFWYVIRIFMRMRSE